MTGTLLKLVNNQKTKVAASYKILFCDNRTTFKHQYSKGENKKKKGKKETSRDERVFANLQRNESNLLLRCVRWGFVRKSFYLFFQILVRPGPCRVRSLSVWRVRLFRLQFTQEEWWLNFRGSITMQQWHSQNGTKLHFFLIIAKERTDKIVKFI